MPNHVTHKILFEASRLDEIKAAICDEDCVDFEKLIPSPPQMYHGNLSSQDDQDFQCNWNTWSRENWGTKWNAYQGKTGVADDGRAFIKFDTAWSIPYPVIAAFCNRFQVPFEHRYFDEGHNFWGIETWSVDKWSGDRVTRTEKRFNKAEDKNALCIELKGYDPDKRDEDAA